MERQSKRRSQVQFSVKDVFFATESLLKTTQDCIWLFHLVNYECESLFTTMTPAIRMRGVHELNKQKEPEIRPKNQEKVALNAK